MLGSEVLASTNILLIPLKYTSIDRACQIESNAIDFKFGTGCWTNKTQEVSQNNQIFVVFEANGSLQFN
jgi:hypothetical protein